MPVAGFILPLRLVQVCSSAGLAITAVIQHIGRLRAMRPMMRGRGLGMIAVTVQPGPATSIHSVLLVLIAAGNALGLLTLLPGFNRLLTLAAGMFSGVLSVWGRRRRRSELAWYRAMSLVAILFRSSSVSPA